MNQQQTADNKKETFAEWALVEIMGHQRIAGRVTEAIIAGAPFLRVDVPEHAEEKAFTRFYGASSIYCISPVTEEIARGLSQNHRNEPVSRYELPQIAEKVSESIDRDVDADDDDDNSGEPPY